MDKAFVIIKILMLISCVVNNGVDGLIRPFPNGIPTEQGIETLVQLKMPGVSSKKSDENICTGFTLENEEEFWIKQIRGKKLSEMVHHMNLFGCEFPLSAEESNPCNCPMVNRSLVYSWGKFSPPIRMPPSVGFWIGGASQIKYLFLEVHYLNPPRNPLDKDYSGLDIMITREKQDYIAGIYDIMGLGKIPPLQPKVWIDSCFTVKIPFPIKLFAYRPHTHGLGKVVSAYKLSHNKNNTLEMIGKGNPQWPQGLYPTTHLIDLESGDVVLLRCTYDSSKRTTPINTIYLPAVSPDMPEMCFMSLVYMADPRMTTTSPHHWKRCTKEQRSLFPSDADEELPVIPELDEHANYGNQTGIIQINDHITLNLDLEDFGNLFQTGTEINVVGFESLRRIPTPYSSATALIPTFLFISTIIASILALFVTTLRRKGRVIKVTTRTA